MYNRSFSDYLFARPSLFSGIARLFDFWGLYDSYNVNRSPGRADAKALYSDWRTVGYDVRNAIKRYSREQNHS